MTPPRVGSYGARMAGVVFPGETLRVTVWKEDGRFAAVSPRPAATTPPCCPAWSSFRSRTVLDNQVWELGVQR